MFSVLKKLFTLTGPPILSTIAERQISNTVRMGNGDVITYANSEGSDETRHPHGLARIFAVQETDLCMVCVTNRKTAPR